jgi:hypothetical protein
VNEARDLEHESPAIGNRIDRKRRRERCGPPWNRRIVGNRDSRRQMQLKCRYNRAARRGCPSDLKQPR